MTWHILDFGPTQYGYVCRGLEIITESAMLLNPGDRDNLIDLVLQTQIQSCSACSMLVKHSLLCSTRLVHLMLSKECLEQIFVDILEQRPDSIKIRQPTQNYRNWFYRSCKRELLKFMIKNSTFHQRQVVIAFPFSHFFLSSLFIFLLLFYI